MTDVPERIWANLHINGPRLDRVRLLEIIKHKEFRHDESYLFPGTLLDSLKEVESLSSQLAGARRHVARLRQELKQKDEALKFYADLNKYPAPLTGGMGELWKDCGQKARAALAEKKRS